MDSSGVSVCPGAQHTIVCPAYSSSKWELCPGHWALGGAGSLVAPSSPVFLLAHKDIEFQGEGGQI